MADENQFQPFPKYRSCIVSGIVVEARMTDKPGRLHQRLPGLAADGRSGSRMAAALDGCADDGRHAKRYFQRGGLASTARAGIATLVFVYLATADGWPPMMAAPSPMMAAPMASRQAMLRCGMAAPSPMAMGSSTRRRWRWKVELSAAPAADGIQTRQGVFVGSSWFQDWPPPLLALAVPMAMAAARLLTLPPSLAAASVPF